jgi:predicted acyltransferase
MLIDVLKWRKWSFFFRVIGMNSIFIYLFLRIVDINILVSYIFGWSVAVFGEAGAIVPLLGKIVLAWGLLYYMYKKEIFIKV